MRREFPTSIFSGPPKHPRCPRYKQTTLLDITRAEKRLKKKLAKITAAVEQLKLRPKLRERKVGNVIRFPG